MSFFSYLFPRELFRGSSIYSSDIRVIEESGSRRLLVNGIEQSGKNIDTVLKFAFNACEFSVKAQAKKMLLLGIGGGSFIRLFRNVYPSIEIDAVDIDSEIIQVSKTYFGLMDMKMIHVYNVDALKFVKDAFRHRKRYGIIVIDLYIGRNIPDFVWKKSFLEKIHILLTPGGSVFINVVHDGVSGERVKKLKRILLNLFKKTKEIPVDFNTFFLATA